MEIKTIVIPVLKINHMNPQDFCKTHKKFSTILKIEVPKYSTLASPIP